MKQQLGFGFDDEDQDDEDHGTDYHLCTPQAHKWLLALIKKLPEGTLMRKSAEFLPEVPNSFLHMSRAHICLTTLRIDKGLSTRDIAAMQLLDSTMLRSNMLRPFQLRYLSHVAATGSVRLLLEIRSKLLQRNEVDVPDDMKPEFERKLIMGQARPLAPITTVKLGIIPGIKKFPRL